MLVEGRYDTSTKELKDLTRLFKELRHYSRAGDDPSPFITEASLEHNAQATVYDCYTFLVVTGADTDNRLKDVEFPMLENRICNRPEFLNGTVKNHEFCGGFTFGGIGNCEVRLI